MTRFARALLSIGLRERATELGGTFTLDASPRGGTCVRVTLPL